MMIPRFSVVVGDQGALLADPVSGLPPRNRPTNSQLIGRLRTVSVGSGSERGVLALPAAEQARATEQPRSYRWMAWLTWSGERPRRRIGTPCRRRMLLTVRRSMSN
jgi:hypothetical protein